MSEEKRGYYCIIPADVLDDERIPDGAKLLYGEITALCSEKGFCFASNDYLASRRKRRRCTIISWINTLVECGYLKRELCYDAESKEVKERRLYLRDNFFTPYEKSDEGGMKNQTTPYEKSDEGGMKNQTTPYEKPDEGGMKNQTENNTINNTVNNTINKYTADFEEFWKLYPRKVEKAAAYKAYKARLKEGVSKDTLLTAVKNYNRKITDEHTTETYIKYPKSFLSKDRSFDDYLEYKSPQDRQEEKPISKLVYEGDDLPF